MCIMAKMCYIRKAEGALKVFAPKKVVCFYLNLFFELRIFAYFIYFKKKMKITKTRETFSSVKIHLRIAKIYCFVKPPNPFDSHFLSKYKLWALDCLRDSRSRPIFLHKPPRLLFSLFNTIIFSETYMKRWRNMLDATHLF